MGFGAAEYAQLRAARVGVMRTALAAIDAAVSSQQIVYGESSDTDLLGARGRLDDELADELAALQATREVAVEAAAHAEALIAVRAGFLDKLRRR